MGAWARLSPREIGMVAYPSWVHSVTHKIAIKGYKLGRSWPPGMLLSSLFSFCAFSSIMRAA
jgi:hypothetical protein